MLHFNTDHRPSCRPAQQPYDTDSDEYGSFDEEEIKLLNDIFEVHPLSQGQASESGLYPVLPKPVLNISSQAVTQPSLEASAKLSSLEDFEGQFDGPEDEGDVEASERGFQKPRLRHLGSQAASRGGVLEVQYESIVQPSTTGISSYFF